MATEDEIRAAAVRETAAYLERVTRKGLVPLSAVLADLGAVAERMSQGMTARGSLRSPVSANREDSEPAPDTVPSITELAKHAIGDRVRYRYESPILPRLTGEVARIARADDPHPLYGVRWDDEPERIACWYTGSMLVPIS